MTESELIAKQQLEIENLKEWLEEYKDSMQRIHGLLFNIGAPLNDNILGFNKEQRLYLHKINHCLILEVDEK